MQVQILQLSLERASGFDTQLSRHCH